MVIPILIVFSATVVITEAAECFYKGVHLPHNRESVELKSMNCEFGCCGTLDLQKCCKELNWWMVFAFAISGLFLIIVIILAIYLIIKQKNKKKEQVGYTTNNQAYENQPSTVDLSIFRTDDSSATHPPPYSFTDGRNHEFSPISRRQNTTTYTRESYSQNEGTSYNWRETDLSYYDMYLERSKSGKNERWNAPVDYDELGHAENITSPSKLDAEFETPLPYGHPELTAESRYLGHTCEDSSELLSIERGDSAQFHNMTSYN